MGKDIKNENGKAIPKTQINIHEARLRKLLQVLKEKEAKITIDHDEYSRSITTSYGEGNDTDHKLKVLPLTIWENATNAAYYEYFKDNYEVSRKKTVKEKHHESYEKFITGIKCTFKENGQIDNPGFKEQLFFSGDRRQMTNVLAAFPNLRLSIIQELEQFADLLDDGNENFPYQQLRNLTATKFHRYRNLEKNIFQYFKDTDSATLNIIKENLYRLTSEFIIHLKTLEKEGVGHEKPGNGRILDNRITFNDLSNPENIEINSSEIEILKKDGFQDAFKSPSKWFDGLRFKKLSYWKRNLEELPISDWPEYYLEQVLLAYIELNIVCSKIISIRDSIFDKVGFYILYSKDGKEVLTVKTRLSLQALSKSLSNYEFRSNTLVDKLRSDGNLLRQPLSRLPQGFNMISSPDRLFFSRFKKYIWEYLLDRMCDSCQLNKTLVAGFYTPLHRLNT